MIKSKIFWKVVARLEKRRWFRDAVWQFAEKMVDVYDGYPEKEAGLNPTDKEALGKLRNYVYQRRMSRNNMGWEDGTVGDLFL